MAQIIAKVSDLGKAMTVASLATNDDVGRSTSHALFLVKDGTITIRATDKDRVAFTQIQVEGQDEMSFTAEPKNILALLKTADKDTAILRYDDNTKTLDVFVSDDPDAYVSLPSLNAAEYPVLADMLKGAVDISSISADMLDTAFKFQLGFISPDEKNTKWANLYLSDGVLRGSDGANRIGAFKSDEFSKIERLVFRRSVLQGVLDLTSKMGLPDVMVKETERLHLFVSLDGLTGFGFKKSVVEIPRIPVVTTVPEGDCIRVDRTIFLKKINRLSIAMRAESMNIRVTIDGDSLSMETITDRKSIEKMQCSHTSAENTTSINFLITCKHMENALALFKIPTVSMYLGKNRCTIYNAVEASDKEKAYISVAMLSLPRDVE